MELNLKRPIVFLDLETTGVNVGADRIVEIGFLKIFRLLAAGLVFVDPDHIDQVVQFQVHRATHREIDQIVVEEWYARLQAMRHAQLVLDHQQAVQEGLALEVQRVIYVAFR